MLRAHTCIFAAIDRGSTRLDICKISAMSNVAFLDRFVDDVSSEVVSSSIHVKA